MPQGMARPRIRLEYVASAGPGIMRGGTVTVVMANDGGKPDRLLLTFRIEEENPGDIPPDRLTLDHFASVLFYAEVSVLFSNGAVYTEKVDPRRRHLLDLLDEAKSGWFTIRHGAAVTIRRVEGVQAELKFIDE